MSTATAEKQKPAPAPLTSFLTKVAPAPKPVEKKEEAKAEEKKDVKETPAAPEKVAVEAAEKEPEKAEVKQEVKAEEKPKDDKTEKRLKDAQTWGNEEHKARLEAERRAASLEAQLKRIEEKLDGTFVEPALPSTEQVTADADVKGRIRASHKAAVRQYGDKYVMETVWNADSPYQELQARDPRIKARVMEADDPVLEAIAVVQEEEQKKKYGKTPEEWREKIEAELTPQIEKKVLEGLKTKPGPATNTLGNVRGGTERTEQKADAPTRLDFRQVFPWGASRT